MWWQVLKHRLLARAGWTVVQVPFWEWDRRKPARAQYLEAKIAEARLEKGVETAD